MTGEEDNSLKIIDLCRKLNLSAAHKFAEQGISPGHIALASIGASFDIASDVHGSQIGAIEWLRTQIDMIERGIMEAAR